MVRWMWLCLLWHASTHSVFSSELWHFKNDSQESIPRRMLM